MYCFDLSNGAGFNNKISEEWLCSVETDRTVGCDQEVTYRVIQGKVNILGGAIIRIYERKKYNKFSL